MKCVILAAGFGSRLQPFTSHRPKQMLPVGGKPILLHGLEYIRDKLEITDIIIVVGHQRQNIMDYFGDGQEFGVKITYVVQHLNSKRGLAAALQLVEEHINSDFCLYLADNLFGADLRKVLDEHREYRPSVTLHVEEHENPSRFGVVITDDKNNITGVVEKPKNPPSNLVITGFYVFSPVIFQAMGKLKPSARGEYELTDAIQILINEGQKVRASTISGWRQDFGYADDILSSNKHLMSDWGTTINSELENCQIVEPVYIGKNCTVKNSIIGPYATLGDNCILEDSIISETVVLDESNIVNCKISNSVIGSKCSLEGLVNYNLRVGDYSQIKLANGVADNKA